MKALKIILIFLAIALVLACAALLLKKNSDKLSEIPVIGGLFGSEETEGLETGSDTPDESESDVSPSDSSDGLTDMGANTDTSFGPIGEFDHGGSGSLGTETDTEAESESESETETEPEPEPEPEPVKTYTRVLSLGDEALERAYIPNASKGIYTLVYFTTALKSNTEYRVSWKINDAYSLSGISGVDFLKSSSGKPAVGFNEDYNMTEGDLFHVYSGENYNDVLKNNIEFKTVNAGDCVALSLLQWNGITDEQGLAGARALVEYIESIVFEEITYVYP